MIGSAINRSGVRIFPGLAVSVESGSVSPAGPGLAANAVALDGAPVGGVVTFATTGQVDLPNWSLATGSQRLIPGSAYYLATDGTLSPDNTTGQAIGQAISPTQLSIQISVAAAPAPFTQVPTPTVTPLEKPGGKIISGTGSPNPNLGSPGDFFYSTSTHRLYGPMVSHGWGSPIVFVS